MPRMLDLFAGRLGWTKAFLARGWTVIAVDLVIPELTPHGVTFVQDDVRNWDADMVRRYCIDFGCASSPCEKFAIFGMAMFHPNPEYPFEGIELFNHTRALFERAKVPYVMENVRPAWRFVGQEANRCGPFSLWGNAVPPILPQGITKGFGKWDRDYILTTGSSKSKKRMEMKAKWAEIPPELANCVADYAGRLLEQKCQTIGT